MQSFILITIQILLVVSIKPSTALYNTNDVEELKKLDLPSYPNCGIPRGNNTRKVNRIFSNPDLDLNDMPWIVSIKTIDTDIHICDGALITPNVVATAAYCLNDHIIQLDNLIVIAGITKFSKNPGIVTLMSSKYKRRVSSIHINPQYEACSQHNNHVMLRLSAPFILDYFVDVACLPNAETRFNTLNCDLKTVQDKTTVGVKYNSGACGTKQIDVSDVTKSLSKLSCEQGNNGTDFIRDTRALLMSCKLSRESNQFYYMGVEMFVYLCGPTNSRYRFYDPILYQLKWFHDTLEKINSVTTAV